MHLHVGGGAAGAASDREDGTHVDAVDNDHDQRQHPVEIDDRCKQRCAGHRIPGDAARHLGEGGAQEVRVVEDPCLEAHGAVARQHPQVEPQDRRVKIGSDVRDHPLRNSADQHCLGIERQALGKRQQQYRDRDRDQDCAVARLQCVHQVVNQQRISGGCTGDHDDQQVGDEKGAEMLWPPALDKTADRMPRRSRPGRGAGHHVYRTSAVIAVTVAGPAAPRLRRE